MAAALRAAGGGKFFQNPQGGVYSKFFWPGGIPPTPYSRPLRYITIQYNIFNYLIVQYRLFRKLSITK